MKLKASLKAVSSRKDVSDDLVYEIKITVYPDNPGPEIGLLQTLYQKPLTIELKEAHLIP